MIKSNLTSEYNSLSQSAKRVYLIAFSLKEVYDLNGNFIGLEDDPKAKKINCSKISKTLVKAYINYCIEKSLFKESYEKAIESIKIRSNSERVIITIKYNLSSTLVDIGSIFHDFDSTSVSYYTRPNGTACLESVHTISKESSPMNVNGFLKNVFFLIYIAKVKLDFDFGKALLS